MARGRSTNPRTAADSPKATKEPEVTEPRAVGLGDLLRIERRYIVDGVLTCITDKGRFQGVQSFGSTEHLVIEDAKTREARMIPLHTISEITLLAAKKQKAAAANAANVGGLHVPPGLAGFDPSFA